VSKVNKEMGDGAERFEIETREKTDPKELVNGQE
jgi:hypothetical protein